MFNKALATLAILAGSFMLPSSALQAQQQQQQVPGTQASKATVSDQDIQLLRADLRSQKKQLIAANMVLTDAEAVKFWPIYDQYTADLMKLNDTRYALIKQYAQTYNNMTDAQAADLSKRSIALDESFVQLRGKYVPIFDKAIPPKKVALFMQLDRRIALLTDLQLASMVPVMKQEQ